VANAEYLMDEVAQRATGPRAEAAAYVADLSADLARIARSHGFDVLGYILDMARLEAHTIATQAGMDESPVN
jgi:hypothetical protein